MVSTPPEGLAPGPRAYGISGLLGGLEDPPDCQHFYNLLLHGFE